jgi:hypothetical protein
MTYPAETDEPPSETPLTTARVWIATPANVTRGWLLFSTLVGFIFVACAIYAAVQTAELDNRVTRERVEEAVAQQVQSCLETNQRRAEAREIALADVEADDQIWRAVDDAIDGGLPEPLRSIVFDGFDLRRSKIETTYVDTDCTPSVRSVLEP